MATGYTRRGLKPCHRPLIAALAEPKMIAGYALRSGNTACVNGAAEFLRATLARLPAQVRVGLVRGDCRAPPRPPCGLPSAGYLAPLGSGFGDAGVQDTAEELACTSSSSRGSRSRCKNSAATTTRTGARAKCPASKCRRSSTSGRAAGSSLLRTRLAERPQSGGKTLLEVPGYRFQALVSNLPRSTDALGVWRRYNGRADIENRIKELGAQFGIRGLCCRDFWATEALHHLAIAAYNLCALLQRRLGQLERCELGTLALAALRARRRVEPRPRQTHPQARRPRRGSSELVAANPRKTHRPAQLPCS